MVVGGVDVAENRRLDRRRRPLHLVDGLLGDVG